MGETKFLPGDVVSFDGGSWQIIGIGPARTSERLRYEMRSGRSTMFRYVDQFDERDDVEFVLDDDELDEIVAAIAEADEQTEAEPEPTEEIAEAIAADEIDDPAEPEDDE